MLVLDICSGLEGASQAMKARGWHVLTLDNDPDFGSDFVADVREWHYPANYPTPDLVWASPPCTEFSRESMPWCKTGKQPDISIMLACKRIIDEINPKFWIIENVRGAMPYFEPHLGKYSYHVGPFYLWGYFPNPGRINFINFKKKESYSSTKRKERAKIPFALSNEIATICEAQDILL